MTVAFTHGFLEDAADEGMTETDLARLADRLAAHPQQGHLLSAGCRKVRFARTGQGKSGGFRVITLYVDDDAPLYCIAVLAKGTRANFSVGELDQMAALAKTIRATFGQRRRH